MANSLSLIACLEATTTRPVCIRSYTLDIVGILDSVSSHWPIRQGGLGRSPFWQGKEEEKVVSMLCLYGGNKFGSYYLKHEYYFDVHPPLGKMLVGLSGWIAGYNGSFEFESGQAYPEEVRFSIMRLFNAFWGALLVPVAYFTARQFKMSFAASILAATMVMCGKVLRQRAASAKLLMSIQQTQRFCASVDSFYWTRCSCSLPVLRFFAYLHSTITENSSYSSTLKKTKTHYRLLDLFLVGGSFGWRWLDSHLVAY